MILIVYLQNFLIFFIASCNLHETNK